MEKNTGICSKNVLWLRPQYLFTILRGKAMWPDVDGALRRTGQSEALLHPLIRTSAQIRVEWVNAILTHRLHTRQALEEK